MKGTCRHCEGLVSHGIAHPELKKISELNLSTLYKCKCCHSYLHHHGYAWEIISCGNVGSIDENRENNDVEHITETNRPSGLLRTVSELPRILFSQKD